MRVPTDRPKILFTVTLISMAVTEMPVALELLDGPTCSFKVTEPSAGREIVVLGAGVSKIGTPARARPTKVEELLLDAVLESAVLLATVLMAVAVIKPESSETFWTLELALTVTLPDVRLVVVVSAREPELTNPPRFIDAPDALMV